MQHAQPIELHEALYVVALMWDCSLIRGLTSVRQRRPLPPRFFGPYE